MEFHRDLSQGFIDYSKDLGLRFLGLYGIWINPVVLSSLVRRLFDQIRIFTQFVFPEEIKDFKYARENEFFAELRRVSNIFVKDF